MAENAKGLDRRSMLKRTALAGGALFVPGSVVMKGAGDSGNDRTVRRLGLLVPSGPDHAPTVDAIRSGLLDETATTDCRLIAVEQRGGISGELEGLFFEKNVDAVVCYANTICVLEIAEVANRARRTVCLIDSGANPVDPRAYSPWLQISTLDIFDKNRRIGRAAADGGRTRGIALLSVSEAGFQTADAIRQGFEQQGGSIDRYIVVDRPELDEIDRESVRTALAEVRPDVVFSLGDRGVLRQVESLVGPAAVVVRNYRDLRTSEFRRLASQAARNIVHGSSSGVADRIAASFGSAETGIRTPYLG